MAPKEDKPADSSQRTMFAYFKRADPSAPKASSSSSAPRTSTTQSKPTASTSSSGPAPARASSSKSSPSVLTPPPTSEGESLSAVAADSSRTSDEDAPAAPSSTKRKPIVVDDSDSDGAVPSPKKRKPLTKKRSRVIDSDDDESDAPKPVKAAKQPAAKKPRASVSDNDTEDNFFDDDLDDALGTLDDDAMSVASSSAPPKKPAAKKRPDPKPVQGKKAGNKSGSGSNVGKSGKATTAEKQSKHDEAFEFVVNRRDKDGRTPDDPDFDPRTIKIAQKYWDKLTPMEEQFWRIKQDRMDTILFFQKGKFFELYEQDARLGHQIFDLKLTDRAKMCMVGVPEQSFELWASKFLSRGYKVGRVEQTETALGAEMRERDEKKPKPKGKSIVNRELKRVLTQATQVENLEDDQSRHCVAIKETGGHDSDPTIGLCILDAATAEFQLATFVDDVSRTKLETTLRQLRPLELLYEKQSGGQSGLSAATMRVLKQILSPDCIWTQLRAGKQMCTGDQAIERLQSVVAAAKRGADDEDDDAAMDVDADEPELPRAIESLRDNEVVMSALGGMLWYLREANLEGELVTALNFSIFDPLRDGGCLHLDGQTLAHIEVLQNSHGTDEGTLLRMLNRCVTPYGRRLFKQWLCAPLKSARDINARLDTVEDLMRSDEFRAAFDKAVKGVPDLERIISRIHAGTCKPKDFVKVLKSFRSLDVALGSLKGIAEGFRSDDIPARLKKLPNMEEPLDALFAMYDFDKENDKLTPLEGADEDYDAANERITEVEGNLAELLEQYKVDLECKKIEFKHIGIKEIYQIEVPADVSVPKKWTKVSGTKKFQRYYTKDVESEVKQLKEARETLDAAVRGFKTRLYAAFDERYKDWLRVIRTVAELDCLLSLSKASASLGEPACRPEIVEADTAFVDFTELRHPCALVDNFIPNDLALGGDAKNVILLTGPNMAGKSTLLRMTCVAVIMAQLGMYVPASSARVAPCDRINTRMGAEDRIFSASSTFKVELDDCQKILKEATPRSLVILDELGRGTSTWDGMAIAYSVLHHLATHAGCLTAFSTHYSQLVDDMLYHSQIRPMHMLIQEAAEDSHLVTFLYKLGEGAAKGSFGPSVAKLAGLDSAIVNRAVAISRDMQVAARAREHKVKDREAVPLAIQADMSFLLKAWLGGPSASLPDSAQLGRTLAVMADGFAQLPSPSAA